MYKGKGERKRSDSQLKQTNKQTNKTTKTKTTKNNNNSLQNKHLQKPICQIILLQKQFKGTFFHLNWIIPPSPNRTAIWSAIDYTNKKNILQSLLKKHTINITITNSV